jgi:hypothetical protein
LGIDDELFVGAIDDLAVLLRVRWDVAVFRGLSFGKDDDDDDDDDDELSIDDDAFDGDIKDPTVGFSM